MKKFENLKWIEMMNRINEAVTLITEHRADIKDHKLVVQMLNDTNNITREIGKKYTKADLVRISNELATLVRG